jgi:pyruvate/2-oxoglutarate dehydrogenase complex dihydrolipoamide acyltransferase (E2) component
MEPYDILQFPTAREIVVDAGYLGTGRHIIHALVEVDVTLARQRLRELSSQSNTRYSFTAFIVASLARAININPRVQAYLDWRRRLVVFHDVDVVTMIEPKTGAVAIPHIIRSANHKSVLDISAEIRSIQSKPKDSQQHGKLIALAPRLPRFLRLFFFWILKKNPIWFKRMEGTTVVTSIGMFGKGGGWGIGFLPTHTLGLTVGGIARKPGLHEEKIAIREILNLTVSFDHDIVDGAPAARFTNRLVELLETAAALYEPEA